MAQKTLNARQRAFVLAYSSGATLGNATASARAAGYGGSDEVLNTTGSRMLRNAQVASELQRMAAENEKPAIMDAAELRQLLTKRLRSDTLAAKDVASLGGTLAKMNGWFQFVHRHEGAQGGSIVHEVKVSIGDARTLAKEKP